MAQGEIVNGMDLAKLEAFRTSLKEDPITLGLEVRGTWEGHSGRSTVHIGPYRLGSDRIDRSTRHYTVAYGAWREVEDALGFVGPTDRAEPVEMALAATAACLINSISFNTARLEIDTEDIEINVRTTVDPPVLFAVKGPEQHGSCLGKIEYDVKIKGDVSDEDLVTIKKLCAHSPVHGMMAESIECDGEVTRA